MPIKEGDRYLPHNHKMIAAFDRVNQAHFRIGNTIDKIKRVPQEKLAQASSDYFTAGVAYLANRGHDPYIQEIGTVTWEMVNQRNVLTAMTDNMLGAAIALGVPPEIAAKQYSQNDEPYVLFKKSLDLQANLPTTAFVLLPPEFILRAQSKPLEALATMTWIASQIRDLKHGRLMIDSINISARARASEAHFLKEAVKQHPEVLLSEIYQHVLQSYPEGLDSLPSYMKY